MRLATWNLEWAGPRSSRSSGISAKFREVGADLWVITEGRLGLVPQDGYLIDAGNDWGYGEETERRKVLAWSRHRWAEVRVIDEGAARGRLLVATTNVEGGPVRVVAVCIPWRDAHVATGRSDARSWDEHREFCERLKRLVHELDGQVPTVIVGDFNQRIPRARQPRSVATALKDALREMTVWTKGETPHGQLIDHIAGDARLTLDHRDVWPGTIAGKRLTDHSGVACDVHVP